MMSALARLCAVAVCALAVASAVSIDHREPVSATALPVSLRHSNRHEDPLSGELADRASLLFRALDRDSDRRISADDVKGAAARLQVHMPGVGVPEFLSFLDIADTDGDHQLTRDELLQGIADGLREASQLPEVAPANLLETRAEAQRRRIASHHRGGSDTSSSSQSSGGGAVVFGAEKVAEWAKSHKSEIARRVTGEVDISQDGCVMCQYIVERCEGNVKQAGVIPALSPTVAFDSYLELEQIAQQTDDSMPAGNMLDSEARGDADQSLMANAVNYAVNAMDDATTVPSLMSIADDSAESPSSSLLEVQSKSGAADQGKQLFFDQTAAGIIGGARQATRVQRQLERQKYNEIYRVVDITLDDVCEQGMPNSFYGFCKQIYKVQTDVVDGLRYQYRPTDICFRIGMCGKDSYITKGLHSRYK